MYIPVSPIEDSRHNSSVSRGEHIEKAPLADEKENRDECAHASRLIMHDRIARSIQRAFLPSLLDSIPQLAPLQCTRGERPTWRFRDEREGESGNLGTNGSTCGAQDLVEFFSRLRGSQFRNRRLRFLPARVRLLCASVMEACANENTWTYFPGLLPVSIFPMKYLWIILNWFKNYLF